MQQYVAQIVYEHENYIADIEKKKLYKREIKLQIQKRKLPFFKRKRILKLIDELCNLRFLLNETEQKELILNEEIWSCDCLEYNINRVYELILKNSVQKEQIIVQDFYEYCNVENDIDIRFIKMNDALRKSKVNNPIIILVSDMFLKPFIINGKHRIRKAYNNRETEMKAFILDADIVVDCLISEDYKKAYYIYKKLNKLVGLQLNC